MHFPARKRVGNKQALDYSVVLAVALNRFEDEQGMEENNTCQIFGMDHSFAVV